MVPPLCVIFLSGWGVNSQEAGELFLSDSSQPFLGSLASTYPLVLLSDPTNQKKLPDVYKIMGGGGKLTQPVEDAEKEFCVSSLLSGHDIKQYKYAMADHFGLLTTALNYPCESTFLKAEDNFFPYPANRTLKENPDLGIADMIKSAEDKLKSNSDTLIFMGIGAIKVMSDYKEVALVKKAIQGVHKYLLPFIQKAIAAEWRVLLVSDCSLPLKVRGEASKTVGLPVMLMHNNLDGIRAGESDFSVEGVFPVKTSGKIEDIAPTILSLMGIKQPQMMKGTPLFSDLIKKTFK